MAIARYWRATGVQTYQGADLELSALYLLDSSGARLDASATLTCSHLPASGALATLQSTGTGNVVRFARDAVRSAGFYIAWDCGSAVDVAALRLGSGDAVGTFAGWLDLEYIEAGRWQRMHSAGWIAWPGPRAYAYMSQQPPSYGNASVIANFEGANGSTNMVNDVSGGPGLIAYGGAALSTARATVGSSSLLVWGRDSGVVTSSPPIQTSQKFSLQVSFFVPPEAPGDWYMAVVGQGAGQASGEQNLTLLIDGRLAWARSSALVSATLLSAGAIERGQWHNVVISYDGLMMRMVIDGMLHAELPDSLGWVNTGYPFRIGQGVVAGYEGNRFGFYGWIDGLRIATGNGSLYARAEVSTPRVADAAVVCSTPIADFGMRKHVVHCARDMAFGGAGRIFGTTKAKASPNNLPAKARVVLLHQRSKLLVRETWSDPVTGNFVFEGLDVQQEFLALAEDAGGNFAAVAAQRLVPEVAT